MLSSSFDEVVAVSEILAGPDAGPSRVYPVQCFSGSCARWDPRV